MAIKKILLVSEYSEGALAWNCYHALTRLGYTVTTFSCTQRTTSSHAAGSRIGYVTNYINDFFINKKFLAAVKETKPDLIFLLKAHNLTAKTLRAAKTTCPLLINWYPDNPFTLWNGNSNAEVLKSLPLYDSFVIWSQMLMDPLLSAGCKHVQYAPFAYDETLYGKQMIISEQDQEKFKSDVSFIGSWDTDRQWWLEQLHSRIPDLNLTIWGNGWLDFLPANSPLRALVKPAQYGDNMLKIFRCSAISLNFIRTQNMSSHNMRSIEIPASGSFQLTQRTKEQAELLFQEPTNIACFATPDELAQQVTHYLAHPEERARIAQAAHRHVQQYQLSAVLDQIVRSVTQESPS
jgi:spore maturation protein CgeB